jgi:hypothetical protein
MGQEQQKWNTQCRCKECTGQGLGWIKHVKPKKTRSSNQDMTTRTHNVAGVVVDPATGEVMGSYITQAYNSAPYDYPLPTLVRKTSASRPCYELDPEPRPDVVHIAEEPLLVGVIDLEAERSKRGPKPKTMYNPLAALLKVAHAEHRGWVDDYVLGSTATAGLISNGKLNVSPSHVLHACLLDEISVEVVKKAIRLDGPRTMSSPQARRVCQCARLAIGGMEMYLERNPLVRQQLQYEVDFAKSYHDEQESDAMTMIGDHLAYGKF